MVVVNGLTCLANRYARKRSSDAEWTSLHAWKLSSQHKFRPCPTTLFKSSP